MRTFSRDFKPVTALAPALRTASATGGSIDRLGFEALTFLVSAGAWTNGTHTLVAEHSIDNTTWETIPADQLVGTLPVIGAAPAADKITSVGYSGDARYVRVKSNVTGSPATGAVVGMAVLLGRAAHKPVAA
jgi:hypothetical protein